MKIYSHDAGHMTKMAAMPIYGKNPSKIFFPGTGGPISTKLGIWHRISGELLQDQWSSGSELLQPMTWNLLS